MAEPVRVVAVLGYSPRRGESLHVIAERRLRHAEGLAAGARAVVLSGWSRRPGGRGEGELMRAAWAGPPAELVVDTTARTTIENAAVVAAAAQRLAADEVVVVTSSWHRLAGGPARPHGAPRDGDPRAHRVAARRAAGDPARCASSPACSHSRSSSCSCDGGCVRRRATERQPSPGASAAGSRAPSHR